LWGRKDGILSVRSAARLAQRITQCDLRVLEDCGHYLQEDAGAVFVEQLLEWCGDSHKTLNANSAVPKDTARFFAIL
jgi:pimeloyl-ACP methyl ester carboxylesterase